ncbi:unnamed protein product [Amoebophrya sp. A120]|nr:unnamed protein product [Amoebophrya sp. A120]|eukprot:GSA120T00018610001.1
MAWGPFVRIAAQFVMVAGSAMGKAVREAYKEAAKNPNVAAAVRNRRMNVDEAKNILEVPKLMEKSSIVDKAEIMRKLNAIDAKGVGSPYLQSKISIAETVLLEELHGAGPPKADL